MKKKNKILLGMAAGVSSLGLLLTSVSGKENHNETIMLAEVNDEISSIRAVSHQAEQQLYGIGSISKVFTAAAVMKLSDQGLLDLDTPIIEYIDDFYMADERYKSITPRMLLNHSAGLMGMTDVNSSLFGDNDTYTHDNLLQSLRNQRLKSNPGEMSVYSNDSFTLAEILVERVSKKSFSQFIAEEITIPLGMTDTKTPMDVFDRTQVAATYYKNTMALPVQNLNLIGSGGIYSTARDLCRFAGIFMGSSDHSILSAEAVAEMNQFDMRWEHDLASGDSTASYGLGWDSVNTYPFNQYGIKALSKGGSTRFYFSNLTVLPEENLAVAVVSSGGPGLDQLVAQEIILEVLYEEGLIDERKTGSDYDNSQSYAVPAEYQKYAGLYNNGFMFQVDFTAEGLMITPIGTENDLPQSYYYNGDGTFVSTNGDYVGLAGLATTAGGKRGISTIHFQETADGEVYLSTATYESYLSLGETAYSAPFAIKVKANPLSDKVTKIWQERTEKKYYLLNNKYTSAAYIHAPVAQLAMNEAAAGYVSQGIYKESGFNLNSVQIKDEDTALSFQTIPVQGGRDWNDLKFYRVDGIEYFTARDHLFISEEGISQVDDVKDKVVIDAEGNAAWYRIGDGKKDVIWEIETPAKGSWFLYDDHMECVATSLQLYNKTTISLPENGMIVFVGDSGAEFTIIK